MIHTYYGSNKLVIRSLIAILVLPVLVITTQASVITCNQSCPSFRLNDLPYPFGFSAGCQIRLNCTNDGIFIGDFRVQDIDSESIRVDLQSRCDRPMNTLVQLYSNNYAPTSRNAILLRNCSDDQASSSCEIPSIYVQAPFQAPTDCSANTTSLSCYAEPMKSASFLEYETVMKQGCTYLLSSMYASMSASSQLAPTVSLEMAVVELGWWLEGPCQCDMNANYTEIVSPNGGKEYRCDCKEGFIGDGF